MNENDWTGNTQSVMATLNASNHSKNERHQNDYYATPEIAIIKLLEKEPFTDVWECACGEGHISEILKKYNIHFFSSDIIDRGYGEVIDFLKVNKKYSGDIITNPPFKYSTEFVYKAMEILKTGSKLALLLRIQFLESVKRYEMFQKFPPYKILVFSRNIRCAKNGDFKNATGNASTYAWFIWRKGFKAKPKIEWII
jgi:hypothetical protein